MERLHYKFMANGKWLSNQWVKSLVSKEFFCCSSHNKSFNSPVFVVYKRHVTVAVKIIISLWTGVLRQRGLAPCLNLVTLSAVSFSNLLAVDIFVRFWGAPTGQLFFPPKYHNIFQKIKYLTQLVCSIIYWLWIKCLWLQRESNISKSCLSVGRYQILYLCGALCIMGTVITHKQ